MRCLTLERGNGAGRGGAGASGTIADVDVYATQHMWRGEPRGLIGDATAGGAGTALVETGTHGDPGTATAFTVELPPHVTITPTYSWPGPVTICFGDRFSPRVPQGLLRLAHAAHPIPQ